MNPSDMQGMPGSPPPGMAIAPRPRKQQIESEAVDKISKEINNLAANIRILEERYSLMRNKSQVSEESMIMLEKSVTKDIKSVSDDIMELKHEIRDLMDKLRLISAEMNNLVDKNEFRVIERYLDMWQPMNFVTREELDKIIKEQKKQG
jgi:archaellum component FlaC